MWRRLPLSLKLTVPLVVMQTLAVIGGGLLLTDKIERTRFTEIDALLEEQVDLLEEAVHAVGNQTLIAEDSNAIREIEHDHNFYFRLMAPDGGMVRESSGPSESVRETLAQMASQGTSNERIFSADVEGSRWRIVVEKVRSKGVHNRVHGTPHPVMMAALKVSTDLSELAEMKRNVILGALALSLLTCLGTLGIVSRTTSNLRFFAGSLARINPDAPAWEFSRPSQSKEESQLFESFRNLLAEIAQSRTTLRMFVANASHELKTPVAAIHTALEVLLSRKRSAPEFESTCADMLDVAKDMKRLTNALLDLALADRPSEPSLFNTDLSGVVDSVLQRMSAFASERSVILDVRMASDKPVVNGNKELLEIALGNIVENAVKFSPPGTVVHVEMQQPQAGKVRVTVSDQGKGMTESELLQLGVAFFRADKSRSDGASFGLGFAHAKRIVNASGGEIVVTSRPRIGTQVVMEFNVGDGNATSVV